MRLIEAEFEGETLFPARGKSCSTAAMPHLAARYHTYHDFALASLQEIYTPTCLNDAHRFAATTLESGVLINDGASRFSFRPLPRIAQAAPGFGVIVTDFDADGHADIYMAQNFYTPQPETGRMAGGLSLLLLGKGDGTFAPVSPGQSGIVVPGDARSATIAYLDADPWPDLVVGLNNAAPVAFQNRGGTNRVLDVRLRGKPGNPQAVGARVTVHMDDGSTRTAEVYAGCGYLSQSSARLTFGLGQNGRAGKIVVRWPDGGQRTCTEGLAAGRVVLSP